jgi:predicted lipoprotein with Yx(FWY)xxD motif
MKLSLIALALIAAVALAACGSSGNDAATASSPTATVSLDNGLLVDSAGAALYFADQEKSGAIMCTGNCTKIWIPLKASGQPSAANGVSGKLGTVKRSDGTRQVTLDGHPLYRFAEDSQNGKANGDNLKDAFGGQHFSWHAKRQGGSSGSGSGSGSSGSSGGSGGGAYNY